MTEAAIQRDIQMALGMDDRLVMWRNAIGRINEWDPNTGKAITARAGLPPGSPDLVGVLKPHGRFFALEVKTATGRLSEKQVTFHKQIRMYGGFVATVRSVEDAKAAVERALNGGRE